MHRSLFFSVAILLAVIANPGLLRGQSPQLKLDTVRPNRQAVGEQLPNSATRSPDSSANAIKRLFDPIDLNNRATQLVTEGRFIEAAAKLEQAIQLSPDLAGAHINLSVVYERMGQLQRSLVYGQTGALLAPDSPRAFEQLCGVLFMVGQFRDASGCYQKLVKLSPADPQAQTHLGNALYRSDRKDEAMSILSNVTLTFPTYAAAFNSMGNILFDGKKYADAAAAFKRAVEIDPRSSLFRYNLGISRVMNNNTPAALSQYQALQRLDEDRARKLYRAIFRDKVVYVGNGDQL